MSARKSDLLSAHARAEIDHWLTRYPVDRKQSAVLAALREVQHENGGYLTTELMDAVADYLDALAQQMDRLPARSDVDAEPEEQEGMAA